MNMTQSARDLGLNESEYREILELFVPTAEKDLEAIKMALATGDAGPATRAAHSIKGASANLGLSDIANEALEIEEKSREGQLYAIAGAVKALERHLAELARFLSREAIHSDDHGPVDDRR